MGFLFDPWDWQAARRWAPISRRHPRCMCRLTSPRHCFFNNLQASFALQLSGLGRLGRLGLGTLLFVLGKNPSISRIQAASHFETKGRSWCQHFLGQRTARFIEWPLLICDRAWRLVLLQVGLGWSHLHTVNTAHNRVWVLKSQIGGWMAIIITFIQHTTSYNTMRHHTTSSSSIIVLHPIIGVNKILYIYVIYI